MKFLSPSQYFDVFYYRSSYREKCRFSFNLPAKNSTKYLTYGKPYTIFQFFVNKVVSPGN